MKGFAAALCAATIAIVGGAGAPIAGWNGEFRLRLCQGTTAPLTSPCPFTPGAPISAFYRSTDNGKSWSGGSLPAFDTFFFSSSRRHTILQGDWSSDVCSSD